MSTRWYPLFKQGNPQLRVFLPNFWMKIVRPENAQPENIVQFQCSMEMTKHDIKNYLEKIYNIPVVDVRTRIALGKTKRDLVAGYVTKEDDAKLAYVTLVCIVSYIFTSNKMSVGLKDILLNQIEKINQILFIHI